MIEYLVKIMSNILWLPAIYYLILDIFSFIFRLSLVLNSIVSRSIARDRLIFANFNEIKIRAPPINVYKKYLISIII